MSQMLVLYAPRDSGVTVVRRGLPVDPSRNAHFLHRLQVLKGTGPLPACAPQELKGQEQIAKDVQEGSISQDMATQLKQQLAFNAPLASIRIMLAHLIALTVLWALMPLRMELLHAGSVSQEGLQIKLGRQSAQNAHSQTK